MKISFNKSNIPLGGLITAEHAAAKHNRKVDVQKNDEILFNMQVCRTSNDLARAIAKETCMELYGENALALTEINHWLTFSLWPLSSPSDFYTGLSFLNHVLRPLTYLALKRVTVADYCVFAVLHDSDNWNKIQAQNKAPTNVLRWYRFISNLTPVRAALEKYKNESSEKSSTRAQEGKFVDLPGAEMGKVVVRFPPEASGYLHIGHAKAALLNQYYQEAFKGKLIMRFDDTNPAKENLHFEKVILEDVEMLEIKPDLFTHTSQYFDLMLDYCVKMIKDKNAYVDDTEAGLMKEQREQKIESPNRNNSVEKNLEMWQEMVKGTDKGQQCCVRAKIDMQSPNGCMRDPTIYRCKNEVHPRTGDKYKVYPTYDFACPIVDAIEGVTHTLRTMEYHDRDPQFYWFIEALGLRKPYIWEYSRLSMTNTVLSKRKLTWFVNEKLVDGWDDPRMPTVRGVLRRGMSVQGLKEFIIAQGSSRSVVFMEWDKIWAFNKKVIDPIAPRFTCLDLNPVEILVTNQKEEVCLEVAKHPKNPEIGFKKTWIGPKILIDHADAHLLKEGENATFINWGNLLINKLHKDGSGNVTKVEATTNLDNKDYKKTAKLTWLAQNEKAQLTPTFCVFFEHIISKPLLGKDEDFKEFIGHETRREVQMLGDPELKSLKKGDIIQVQRRGFFKVDIAYKPVNLLSGQERSVVLFYIPDGHTKEVSTSKNKEVKKKKISAENLKGEDLLNQIQAQGDKIRHLKAQKAEKSLLEGEVKVLLSLKTEFKTLTGKDWKPDLLAQKETVKVSFTAFSSNEGELLNKIQAQGDKIRNLKAQKAEKSLLDGEVKILLALKGDFKTLTGKDWKPDLVALKETIKVASSTSSSNEGDLLNKIQIQGDKIRTLKSQKANKSLLDSEVKVLLTLKADYKTLTGKDWKPDLAPPKEASKSAPDNSNEKELLNQIQVQGDKIRTLKSQKADKSVLDLEVKVLLTLKSDLKTLTGKDWKPETSPAPTPKPNKQEKKEKPKKDQQESGVKKQTRLGLEARKEDDLSEWYSQVIVKGELIEYYDVSGCYILRPWSFAIWEVIRDWFDAEIKKLGVQNCYFPIFVSKLVLEKEKKHIEDFAPEVAWVTRSGSTDLAEPIAVRPTSETVMYPAYAKWIQSYRDLPIKLNQWNNVVRWEFKHPQPFLRTREFLWQEGHTAYAEQEEAQDEVAVILDLYARIYRELLAVPVVKGRKTEKEKFAGSDYSLTVEGFVAASGRGIQGATSHHLGQRFSKMFDIVFEDPETHEKKFVFQNSWGLTTRTIGVMIMVHADNQGLILPPKVASIQTIIIPCGLTVSLKDQDHKLVLESCNNLEQELTSNGVKVKVDSRQNYSPGWKFNHWELKGVPIRVELGPKDVQNKTVVAVRRDTGQKLVLQQSEAAKSLSNLLETIQKDMLNKAEKELEQHKVLLTKWDEFADNLDRKNVILAPFCGDEECEGRIKRDSTRDEGLDPGAPSMGAKSLCTPLEQPRAIQTDDKCIHPKCALKPLHFTLFGRSY